MKIVYDGKKLKKFFDQRAEYFHHLSTYLISCMFLYTKFPERNEDPFPPTGESFKELINWFFSSDEFKKYSASIKGYKPHNEEYLDSIVLDFYKNWEHKLQSLKVSLSSINDLSQYCLNVRDLYKAIGHHEVFLRDIHSVIRVGLLGEQVSNKAYEIIGYLTAKMEEKKRNLQSTLPKTKQRNLNKKTIKNLLEELDFNVNREFLTKAQRIIDRGERTVKNLAKEIIKEINN